LATFNISYKDVSFDISYLLANPSNKTQDIIFLHGWGSNKEIMFIFKDYFTKMRMVFIDMPGFGKSSNDMVLNTNDYANIINLFLKKKDFKKDIIIGHSFGGKVATLLNPNLLVLLSTSGILVSKPLIVKSKIIIFKLLKLLFFINLSKYFKSKDVENMPQNMYETFKNIVDEDFSNEFKNFKNNALILWGKEDTATPLWTGKKIKTLISKSTFIEYNGDHYFFMKNLKKIENDILRHI
jgi:pimeloyl-ACP methyl ester carboxylesterase